MPNGQPDEPSYDTRNGTRQLRPDTEHPEIIVEWNETAQGVKIRYDERIKTWDMRIALLEMAVSAAKFDLNVARMQKMQEAAIQASLQQQQVQQQANAIEGKILKGKY